jgi:hypothetical protein
MMRLFGCERERQQEKVEDEENYMMRHLINVSLHLIFLR